MQFRRRSRPSVAIDIAPLVDVIFLLVIFFAVSTTFLESAGLELELPSSTSTAQREVEDLTVVLAADGGLSLEGEEIDHEQLTDRLTELLANAERRVVVLRADTNTPHGEVVKIMDLIQASGAEALTIAARSAAAE